MYKGWVSRKLCCDWRISLHVYKTNIHIYVWSKSAPIVMCEVWWMDHGSRVYRVGGRLQINLSCSINNLLFSRSELSTDWIRILELVVSNNLLLLQIYLLFTITHLKFLTIKKAMIQMQENLREIEHLKSQRSLKSVLLWKIVFKSY